MKKFLLFIWIFLWGSGAFAAPALQEGDLVFQSQPGRLAKLIQLVTHSPYNHVGLVFIRKGKSYVLEAAQPVRFTRFDRWTLQGKGGKFAARRLKNAREVLTPKVLKRMEDFAQKSLGKKYSFTYLWGDGNYYCSSLVWAVYRDTTGLELGKFQKIKELDLSSPLVKKELTKRFGFFWPAEQKVITPGQIYQSDLLVTVEL